MEKQSEQPPHNDWIISCYREVFPGIARYISRRGGTRDEACDIFQDSLVVLYEMKAANKAPAALKSEQAYLAGIAKHQWSRYCDSKNKITAAGNTDTQLPETPPDPEPATARLLQLLGSAGQRCMELLHAFYYDNLSPAKAASRFGYAGERSVTVQKYKCLEKLRNEVKTKKLEHADFLD
jgi:DNA-directed RNA polymerase specialized sigma24 family protein